MKILLLDIETSPNTAHVWGLWQQNVGINQLLESSYVLCWAAKWYKEKDIYFDSIFQSTEKQMLKGIHKLMGEADAIVHYNGTKFDIPTLNKEFLLSGMAPPAPAKQMDLLKVCRRQFRFPSNRLDYVANALGLGHKHHTTHELWIKCMNNDPLAWAEMEGYNKNDVVLLEGVYDTIKPWIKGHPNYSLFEDKLCCPQCGSTHYGPRGWEKSNTRRYRRYRCFDCTKWFQGTRSVPLDRTKEIFRGI